MNKQLCDFYADNIHDTLSKCEKCGGTASFSTNDMPEPILVIACTKCGYHTEPFPYMPDFRQYEQFDWYKAMRSSNNIKSMRRAAEAWNAGLCRGERLSENEKRPF